ncbi:uncharacterized protein LOC141811226 [Halichoeres trimaculatus]|uniref:uncharacterized protein LOC141811226 n=1 Tax=Halichoeres trimaculatus TaxID=147232 RepID=UPI003D9DEC61
MLVCVLTPLVLSVLLAQSASLPPSGTKTESLCPTRWLLFRGHCFGFYPVWSSWISAESVCSQRGGNLASLHSPEDRRFVLQLVNTSAPVWLGGYRKQRNSSWLWSDGAPFRIGGWIRSKEGGACVHMDPKSGDLNSAPCGELKFYICSVRASSKLSPGDRKPAVPGESFVVVVSVELLPGVSVFDVVWSYSDVLVEEILRSSSFIQQLRSGQLTQGCYASFSQQEALYLHRVSSTLEAVTVRLQEVDDVTSLLLDTRKHYRPTNQSLLTSSPPPWLLWSLQSFSSVVLEDPVYLLVALSARSSLLSSLNQELEGSGSEVKTSSLYQEWKERSETEATWTLRYVKAIERRHNGVDVFKAVTIFREHMMNQKSFYKSLDCDVEENRQRGRSHR